jgi:hypothetical protein
MADDPTLVHRRSIELEVRVDGDEFVATGTLRDHRPDAGLAERLHEMSLTLRVDPAKGMLVTEAEADMRRYPHAECPGAEPTADRLVGLSVARGWNRAVQGELGGSLSCAHLTHLATVLGPALVQGMASAGARRRREAPPTDGAPDEQGIASMAWMTGTCHMWADDGLIPQKIAAGWAPNPDEYPSPALVEIQRRAGSARI